MRRTVLLLTALLVLAGCGQPATGSPTPPPVTTPAANTVPSDATPLPTAPIAAEPTAATAAPAPGGAKLTIMAHDSFNVSEDVLAAFTKETGASVEILRAGDAGSALNQAILSKSAPLADLIYGVDNTFLSRALAADILEAYASPLLADLSADLKLDPSNRMLPVDYGYVNINYAKAALADAGLQPPAALEDLIKPEWKGKLAVQNPATSSPGLAFLLATIDHFGEEGSYTWKEYWRDLRANEVYVSPDWTDAYYTQFSGSSGAGPYPLVVSYATSPAAEVVFSDPKVSEPPTGNVLPPGGSFRQIEFVGILKGTKQRALAEQFVDFMLGETFQNDIPLQMFVYPANVKATQPDVFTQFAEVPTQPAGLDAAAIEQNRERWIEEWTEIVLR